MRVHGAGDRRRPVRRRSQRQVETVREAGTTDTAGQESHSFHTLSLCAAAPARSQQDRLPADRSEARRATMGK
ncbi:hypothetical protein GCM10028784_31740 [Myceligenerans cantabricum]